jgi:sulfate transport system permease protein
MGSPKRYIKPIIPGFAFTLTCTLLYLAVMVVVPMVMLLLHNVQIPWEKIMAVMAASRVQNALVLTVLMALCAAAINGVMGLIVSWVLVRYRFFGRGFLDAIIDIPFAIPTAVAGIALATLFHKSSWLGHYLDRLGIYIAFTKAGIVVALIFVGLPFVIRMVQPVLQSLSRDNEEAALALGASAWQSFSRVYFPQLLPSLISGMSLAFARALGEFGSVIFYCRQSSFAV